MSEFKMYELCGELKNVDSAYVFDFIADSKIKSHMYYFVGIKDDACDIRRIIQTESFMRTMQVNGVVFKKIDSIDSETALAITKRVCRMMDVDDIIGDSDILGLLKLDERNFNVSRKLFLKGFCYLFVNDTNQSDSPKKYTKNGNVNPKPNK